MLSFLSAQANSKEISLYDFMMSKNAQAYESEDAFLYSIKDERVQYYVTKANHPAHPYIVTNEVRGRESNSWFKVTGWGNGDEDAAERWVEEIKKINDAKIFKIKAGEVEW